ncbi:ATP-binding protein [Paenibacillus sp. 1_12]|uniref:ATP-binding protein n=1 Tax=Paenibacillus sp. 1_12 TaxID=1566278 RepID=UPI001160A23A|nr:ATP-binding protein [Paenibacillus sp. 1_12]
MKQAVLVGIFIFAGWLAMFFGLQGQGSTLFDLRALPIVFGTIFFRDPRLVLIISIGIALLRYTISGFTAQAITGSINILLLGCLAAFLVALYRRKSWSYNKKALISICSINTLQVIGIATFASMPRLNYLYHIAPYTYPAALLVNAFFVFILKDFYEEQLRAQKNKTMNLILRKQKRELEEKAQQLELASQYKSEFIANMSHELKTPLNSIIALSQLLREEDRSSYSEEEINYGDIIHNSGNELLKMINDMLDISKMETGKMEIVWEMFSVDELVQLIEHQFVPIMEQKSLPFKVDLRADVPAYFVSDAQRLVQILRNLLINAVKFTDQGTITMQIYMDKDSQSGPNTLQKSEDWIIFSIQDTGIGIDKDKQHLIFEAFQQENGAFTRRYGGTGLGLSISLRLAGLLGGTLGLHSVKGEGSRFTLRLPVQPADPPIDNHPKML